MKKGGAVLMLSDLRNGEKLVGANQAKKAVKTGRARAVFIARDAETRVTAPILAQCRASGVAVEEADTMKALGEACGIEVGASVAALLK
jgi:large subunit ribosomal protein L7A